MTLKLDRYGWLMPSAKYTKRQGKLTQREIVRRIAAKQISIPVSQLAQRLRTDVRHALLTVSVMRSNGLLSWHRVGQQVVFA